MLLLSATPCTTSLSNLSLDWPPEQEWGWRDHMLRNRAVPDTPSLGLPSHHALVGVTGFPWGADDVDRAQTQPWPESHISQWPQFVSPTPTSVSLRKGPSSCSQRGLAKLVPEQEAPEPKPHIFVPFREVRARRKSSPSCSLLMRALYHVRIYLYIPERINENKESSMSHSGAASVSCH